MILKRKYLLFFVIFCFLILMLALSYLIGIVEEGMKNGFAQIMFLLGVLFGMIAELIVTRIDERIPE